MAESGPVNPAQRWFIAAASVAGAKRKAGAANQDAFRSYAAPDGRLLVAAVADGAGSARCGALGAQIAAQSAVVRLTHFSAVAPALSLPLILQNAMATAKARVWAHARRQQRPAREYAATVALLLSRDGQTAAAQIGDSVCLLETADGWLLPLPPHRGEYANETRFITDADALSQAQYSVVYPDVARVMLCTDGVLDLITSHRDRRPHQPYFAGAFDWLARQDDKAAASAKLADLLRSPQVRSRTDDDCTILQAELRSAADEGVP